MDFDLDGFLPYRLSVAADAVSHAFSKLYADKAGLSIPEWRVMAHLAHQSPASVRDVTAKVNLEKSAVSRAVSRLEGRGLIHRAAHAEDQRLLSLTLTPAGITLMQELTALASAFNARLAERLGDDGAAFTRALQLLSQVGEDI